MIPLTENFLKNADESTVTADQCHPEMGGQSRRREREGGRVTKATRKHLGAMERFTVLMVVMVLQVYMYIKLIKMDA